MAVKTNKIPSSIIIEVKDSKGNVLGSVPADFREFKTGSKGYFAHGKVICPEEATHLGDPKKGQLQISGNMVIVGSKPQ